MRCWVWLLCLVLLVLGSGCERWRPLTPVELPPSAYSPPSRFERMLRVAQSAGYRLVEVEGRTGRFRVVGFSEGNAETSDPTTYFTVQVYANGVVTVTPSGYLVKPNEGVMHQRVARELDRFVAYLWDT